MKKGGSLQQTGFTKLPHWFFDLVLKQKLTLRELRTVMAIARFTFGYNQKERILSARFIEKATGINFQHINDAIKSLRVKGIILIKATEKHSQSRVISINTNIEQWKVNCNQFSYSNQFGYSTVTNSVTETVTNSVTNKEKDKETNKEIDVRLGIEFEKFWNMYDKKRAKEECWKVWKKLSKEDRECIFERLPQYIQGTQDVKYRKDPVRYLKYRVWEDEFTPSGKAGCTPSPVIEDFIFVN